MNAHHSREQEMNQNDEPPDVLTGFSGTPAAVLLQLVVTMSG
jgi:hypothetical protein